MNQIKIGKFIQSLRKGKNLTQAELAKKIGVSDRTISKWENGRGLPDYEYIQNLCKELGVTFNELMAGEKKDSKDYNIKLEENLISTYKESRKSHKQLSVLKITLLVLLIISILIIGAFMFFGKKDEYTVYEFNSNYLEELEKEKGKMLVEAYSKIDKNYKYTLIGYKYTGQTSLKICKNDKSQIISISQSLGLAGDYIIDPFDPFFDTYRKVFEFNSRTIAFDDKIVKINRDFLMKYYVRLDFEGEVNFNTYLSKEDTLIKDVIKEVTGKDCESDMTILDVYLKACYLEPEINEEIEFEGLRIKGIVDVISNKNYVFLVKPIREGSQ